MEKSRSTSRAVDSAAARVLSPPVAIAGVGLGRRGRHGSQGQALDHARQRGRIDGLIEDQIGAGDEQPLLDIGCTADGQDRDQRQPRHERTGGGNLMDELRVGDPGANKTASKARATKGPWASATRDRQCS